MNTLFTIYVFPVTISLLLIAIVLRVVTSLYIKQAVRESIKDSIWLVAVTVLFLVSSYVFLNTEDVWTFTNKDGHAIALAIVSFGATGVSAIGFVIAWWVLVFNVQDVREHNRKGS